MSADTTVPAPGSYRFVLRRLPRREVELDPTIPELVSCYEEQVYSRNILHPDGLRRRTIFLQHPESRDRLIKLGWQDVTEAWLAALEKPPETSARKTTPRQLRVEG